MKLLLSTEYDNGYYKQNFSEEHPPFIKNGINNYLDDFEIRLEQLLITFLSEIGIGASVKTEVFVAL